MTGVTTDFDALARRVGLLAMALLLLNASSDYLTDAFPQLYRADTLWALLLALFGFSLGALALLPGAGRRWVSLILVGALLVTLTRAQLAAVNFSPLFTSRTDNEMIAPYAVEALKLGQNPYTWNFSDMARVYRDRGAWVTYFLDGSLQNRLTYPILPTLLLYAFQALGIEQVRTVMLLFLLLLLVLMFYGSPARWRPLVLLPLFTFGSFVSLTLGGAQDVIWSCLLVAVILTWRRPVLCALLFGLAVSYRQQPWFVAPFLAVVLWNEVGTPRERVRRIAQFFAISAGVFLLPNLPFIAADARAWALGAFEPAYAQFNVLSQGLGALTQYGVLPLPRPWYTLAQMVLLASALFVHLRHPQRVGQAYWLFPALFFWLYYRGLGNYWIYWLPPLIVATARWLPDALHTDYPPAEQRRWATTRRLLLVPAFALLLIACWFAAQPRPVSLRVVETQGRAGDASVIEQITLQVVNRGDSPLTPRFAVQLDQPTGSYMWGIVSGPQFLAPGEAGEYVIHADFNPAKMIPANRHAQVVLSDAGGDYEFHTVVQVR